MASIHDYTMTVYTNNHHDEYVLDYACVRPSGIRTEIVQGAHRGAVFVYQPKTKPGQVRFSMASKPRWKPLERFHLAGTPMVESVVDMMLTDLGQGTFSARRQRVPIEIGRPIHITSERSNDPMFGGEHGGGETGTPAPPPGFKHETVERDCWVLSNGSVEVAVDAKMLWPVSLKRSSAGKLEAELQVWRMAVNVAPNIER